MPRLSHEKPLGLIEQRVAANRGEMSFDSTLSAVLIDRRPLVRQRLDRWLQASLEDSRVTSVAAIDEMPPKDSLTNDVNLIILSIDDVKNQSVLEDIDRLTHDNAPVPVVLLSKRADLEDIVRVIQHGVRGYIFTDLDQSEVAEALRFIVAGGTFVPAVAVVNWMLHSRTRRAKPTKAPVFDSLTPREAEVLVHLSKGKPNKIIAYELNISESTVKVFVRRILAKLNANNRTELAYLARVTGAD